MTKVFIGFDLEPLTVSVDKILPSRKMPMGVAKSRKFMQIRSSIREIGLIEPLSVGLADPKTGQHVLLDGHIRLDALRELKLTEVQCLVAIDDESYTYNSRINRLSTIQDVDRIYVLHKGRIVEFGSHEELMALEGVYYRLYRLQYRAEEAKAVAAG